MLKRGLSVLIIIFLLAYSVNAQKQGDFDDNGCVDSNDNIGFQQHFGTEEGQESYDSKYDIDGNKRIDFSDFLLHAQLINQDAGCSIIDGETTTINDTTTTTSTTILEETTTTLQITTSTTIAEVVQVVRAPTTHFLTAVQEQNEIVLNWEQSELVDEEITGGVVLNKITGNIGFVDSILNFFRGLIGISPKAADVRGDFIIDYNVYRDGLLIGQVNSNSCENVCEYRDIPDVQGLYYYIVESCNGDNCEDSNSVQVDYVLVNEKPAEETINVITDEEIINEINQKMQAYLETGDPALEKELIELEDKLNYE